MSAVREIAQEPVSRVCPDCNLRRPALEFQAGGTEFLNCLNCWTRYGRRHRRGRPPKR